MKNVFVINSLNSLFPNPKCELNYNSDYTLLIAILLSAECSDKRVNQITPILFDKYPTLSDIKDANLYDLEKIIFPLGLSKNKSKMIKELATILVNNYNSKVPNKREELTKLPGIGIKTSGVFLAEFYNQNYLPVDTHIKRVSYRLGLTNKDDSPEVIEKELSEYFKYKNLNIIHLQLVLFGRYICKASNPSCLNCPFNKKCILTK